MVPLVPRDGSRILRKCGVASIINDHFVAVKVDRDERPDVDTRYQAAVAGDQRARRMATDSISYS